MKSARRIGFFPRCGSNEGDEVSLERENIFPLPAYSRKGAIFHDSIHLLGYSHFYISRVIFRSANDREFHDTFYDNSRNVSYLNHVQKGTWKIEHATMIERNKDDSFLSFSRGTKDLCREIA